LSGIVSPSTADISASLQQRAAERLRGLSDAALYTYLADALYLERRRIEQGRADDDSQSAYTALLDEAAQAIRADRGRMQRAVLSLVRHYVAEIHNRFSERTYNFATRFLPGALTRLLTAAQPTQLLGADFDPASRLMVQGPLDQLRALSEHHTLIITPTHLSNLDSPLIGYGLYAANLPPCIYGAGLNLFTNPAMSFFMSRLGAYTVDRRKTHRLYKDTLKDYSTESLRRGAHSLFFPGGTRSRTGLVETDLKKGLLGTAIQAWQENLAAGKTNGELLVVPCTLTFALVLEAETLIEDALAESGQSRYIITDDEFSEARTVASFARRVLSLDASTYIRFGAPLDLLGNPVDADGRSLGPDGEPIDRADYVTGRDGKVQWDAQRDRVYTDRLSAAITDAYRRDSIALSTHVAGFVAWELLQKQWPRLDTFQLAVLRPAERKLPRAAVLAGIERVIAGIHRRVAAGQLREALPEGGAEGLMEDALFRFSGYHKRPALRQLGEEIEVGPKLALYYGNRLRGHGLEKEVLA
jgi:glycerol-3-phosphate O-acyltransferase